MRDERKKQARSNKQTRQSNTAHPRQSLFLEKMSCLRWDSNPQHSYTLYMFLMRDEKEERKKQARSNRQTRQSNTAHPRQSFFLKKMSCLGWDSNPRHSIICSGGTMALYTLDRALYQLSCLGPNLKCTSHSAPDEEAYYQLSMKEKAGAMKPPKTPNTKMTVFSPEG